MSDITIPLKDPDIDLQYHFSQEEEDEIRFIIEQNALYHSALEAGMGRKEASKFLAHYGRPHEGNIPHSGRYAWGTGQDPYQGMLKFEATVARLRKAGMSDTDIYKHLGLRNSQQFRAKVAVSNAELTKYRIKMAKKLKEKGMSNVAIAERMFGDRKKDTTVHNLLKKAYQEDSNKLSVLMRVLADEVEEKKYIQVGEGVELYLGEGVTKQRLETAVEAMADKGYKVCKIRVPQLGKSEGNMTTVKVLCKDDRDYKTVYRHLYQHLTDIQLPWHHTEDYGNTFDPPEPPRSISSKRIKVVYAEDGGLEKDGVIEIRPGLKDLDLGRAHYAQVRIAVDGTHYLKGMCVNNYNMPKGVDIIFYTNKKRGTPMMGDDKLNTVLKKMEKDENNPFGATIRDDEHLRLVQRHYIDDDGTRKLNCLNIVNEEGDWREWSRTIASQMLSKQSVPLAKKQLNWTLEDRIQEYKDILSIPNTALRQIRLLEFADGCDASAVDLKAHGFPGQVSQVILPCNSLSDNECYAPNFPNGTRLVLIRYPHASIHEIPYVTVNNNNKEARKIFGEHPVDAIAINTNVAAHLSGADFDGDTVLAIPNNNGEIEYREYFKELIGWDPKDAYRGYEGMRKMTKRERGLEMGKITNLITDMTVQHAPPQEMVRAIRHSMVVIDAYKHGLDFKQSYEDNRIEELKQRYQMHPDGTYGGASTLFSRATSEIKDLPHRRYKGIDPETGKKIYEETGRTYTLPKRNKKTKEKIYDEDGNIVMEEIERHTTSTQMAETDDAFTLVSKGGGNAMERVYARYANQMKAMANEARKEYLRTPNMKQDPGAKQVYSKEIASVMEKVKTAEMSKALEKQALILANAKLKIIRAENNDMEKDELKKLRNRILNEMRDIVGAHKARIGSSKSQELTERELMALNAGAFSHTMMKDRIFGNMDTKYRNNLFLPKDKAGLTPGQKAKAIRMLKNGYSQGDVAMELGISVDTLVDEVNMNVA